MLGSLNCHSQIKLFAAPSDVITSAPVVTEKSAGAVLHRVTA